MKKQIGIICLLSLVFFTCEELLEETPTDVIVTSEFFTRSSDAEVALIGAYNYTFRSDVSTNFIFYSVRSSDDMTAPLDGQESDPWMWRPNMSVGDGNVNSLYGSCYRALANINSIISQVDQMDQQLFVIEQFPEVDRKAEILGEARFLRAWMYYNMVLFWGDVPLILDPPESVDPMTYRVPRTDQQIVMDTVMSDLDFAEVNLPPNYDYQFTGAVAADDAGALPVQKGRATKAAAMMLKARIYMQNREWQQVIDKSREVIALGEYELSDRFVDIFDATLAGAQNSTESILETQSLAGAGEFNNTGGYAWFTTDGRPRRGATLEALELFDGDEDNPLDVRREFSMNQRDDNPGQIYAVKYANSFPWWNPDNGDTFNFVIFRLTEAYLNIAESLNELSYPNSEALEIVNTVRARAQDLVFNPPTAGIPRWDFGMFPDQASFRQALRDERRRELMFEGHRWFDLMRYDEMDGTTLAPEAVGLTEVAPGYDVSQTRLLCPVPEQAIVQNPELVQNPAYQ